MFYFAALLEYIFWRKLINSLRWVAYKLKLFKEIEGIDLDYNILTKIDENLGNYWNCLKGHS